ncbi:MULTISPECIES: hypothetical protein [Chryseobacterium]|uniref:Uncharacterized protein n=1 Tax=Chryseobacterium bernardetii TaxID=1241978 RepID=A0A3G6U3L1_9FLAO|nr:MULTISPECIES: hypothetical protein [Chryseobacterium]AZB26560.1 hypothetical protein EG339_19170 [Chryseobacterium bernardetii]AZB33050.1 hypothetical protein EG351_05050 [Chryseobacterium bernardetii]UCA60835.1 hypothetical protein KB553_04720 [Chryseobacterium rhizoplanae]
MKTRMYTLPLLVLGICGYSQDRIVRKNGISFEAEIIEIGASDIIYKELDHLEGPIHSLNTSC